MTLTAGVVSLVQANPNSLQLSATAATGGTGPYTEAWYISTTTGFSPGSGNIVAGASGLSATITGLIPATQYYVKVVYTDVGASATITSTQLASTTIFGVLSQNAFAQSPYLGMIDLRFDYDTLSGEIASSQATPLCAGAAVKLVPQSNANAAPQFVGCAANSDQVFGFINFDIKTVQYVAGSVCEVSQSGNVMYLYATGAITQGSQVTLDLTTLGGVAVATGSSGSRIVGWAYDGAASAGALIRIKLSTPSFVLD